MALRFRPGTPGRVPDAWIVGPESVAPPVVAVHGITRGAEAMATLLAPRAHATGRRMIVPLFDEAGWRRYQRAACRDRADLALLRLMAALRAESRAGPGRFDLAGFSGGAQFAHRFAWLHPGAVGRLCATAPGWWTFPDADTAWPRGIGVGRTEHATTALRLQANLRAFLNREIFVCVGGDDIARDRNLRQGPAVDAQQGETRATRARRWAAAAEAQARAIGLMPRIRLRVLQGCGHDFAACVAQAALDCDFVAPARTTTESNRERIAA